MILRIFPFMSLVVALYNAVALKDPGSLNGAAARFRLPSGAEWVVGVGDLLVIIAIVLLFIEIVTATSARTTAIINHGLSLVVFIVCLIEFIIVPACGTSTFLVITLLTLVDVVAGYSISIQAARRDFALSQN